MIAIILGAFVFILIFDKSDPPSVKAGYIGFMTAALAAAVSIYKTR